MSSSRVAKKQPKRITYTHRTAYTLEKQLSILEKSSSSVIKKPITQMEVDT